MTVLLDTNVLYAHHDRSATRHEAATRAMTAVLSGRYGQPVTTDYVYDEAVTLAARRTDTDRAARLGRRIRGAGEFPGAIDLWYVGEEGFHRAVELYERFDDQQLSFTDATIVALSESRNVDSVLSFDDDFDGVVDRLDPAEA